MTDKLSQENSLGSSISLSKRVKHISPTIKIDDGIYIAIIIVSDIAVIFLKSRKYSIRKWFDRFRQSENSAFFRNRSGSYFASPIIKILKDIFMYSFIMIEPKIANDLFFATTYLVS